MHSYVNESLKAVLRNLPVGNICNEALANSAADLTAKCTKGIERGLKYAIHLVVSSIFAWYQSSRLALNGAYLGKNLACGWSKPKMIETTGLGEFGQVNCMVSYSYCATQDRIAGRRDDAKRNVMDGEGRALWNLNLATHCGDLGVSRRSKAVEMSGNSHMYQALHMA